MIQPRVRHSFLLAAVVVVLAACSGSGPAAATAAGPTRPAGSAPAQGAGGTATRPATTSQARNAGACSIVTNEAVGTAGGFTVAQSSGTDTICVFQSSDLRKSLTVKLDRSQSDMASMLQIESGGEHIAGLGDDAFWVPTGLLFVRKGDHGLELLDPDLAGFGAAGVPFRDALVALARTALPNV